MPGCKVQVSYKPRWLSGRRALGELTKVVWIVIGGCQLPAAHLLPEIEPELAMRSLQNLQSPRQLQTTQSCKIQCLIHPGGCSGIC